VFDTRAFKRHLEHFALPSPARAQVFTRLEDYRVHLLNRLGQLKDSFPAKIVKGLAFSPLTDIRLFVHNYLLDENLLDVKTLQAQLDTLRHFESLAADVRQRIEALNHIEELDKERSANRRRRITNGYIARRAAGEVYRHELQEARLKLDEARLALSRSEIQRDQVSSYLKFAENALLDARIALQTDQTVLRARELRERLAAIEAELADLHQRQAAAEHARAREHGDARRLAGLLPADNRPTPPALAAFLDGAPAQAGADQLRELQAAYAELGQEYTRQQALLGEQAAGLRIEAARLEDEIRKLRTGDREVSYESEAPQASRLRRLLRAELGLSSEEVVFLCTVLRIPDAGWQDAAEGILGQNRFTLLVPPDHYDAAMRLYRERRHKDGLHSVALLDTAAILQHASGQAPRSDSLAAEVITQHPAARAFVDLLLGHYVKCEHLEDLRTHRTAVTRECFVRRNYTDSHLNPQVYGRWFIGERAVPRQIESRQQRLDELAAQMAVLAQRDGDLRQRLSLTQEKTRPLTDLEHALEGLTVLPERERQRTALADEISRLDLRAVETLQAEVARCQAEYNRMLDESRTVERKIGSLEAETRALAEGDLPRLEQAIDQAWQNAEAFLAAALPAGIASGDGASDGGQAPGAEDLRGEIEKEYQRRLERQPAAVVQQNAERYESDYQAAEARQRDRLREAKQAYSLRYDFGYDEEEHAMRYAAECRKLTGSELPQYEAQIAHQRSLAEQELVENFIHRLREQIEEARQQLAYLNMTLAALRFGGERYEFITQPAPGLRAMYDLVMDSQNVLGASLFDSGFRQKHQQAWDLLLERLTANNQSSESLAVELHELQDYRSYLQYDIRIHYPNGDRALLSQINAKKSGGETTTPFYVAMAASFAQAYRLNQPRPSDTIRLALFDEAFGKMDTARTASALKFMREAGLQVLLATPPDKSGSLLPFVDTVCTVVRKNSHAFVIEIDKSEMQHEIEQQVEG